VATPRLDIGCTTGCGLIWSYVETLVLDERILMLDMGFIDDCKKNRPNDCAKGKQTVVLLLLWPFKVVQLADHHSERPKESKP